MIFLRVRKISKSYTQTGLFRQNIPSYVLKDVSFDIYQGEILALVGESGCGKTSLGKCILRLTDADEGQVFYQQIDLLQLTEREFRPYRPKFQMIFQNAGLSLDNRQTIASCLSEALRMNRDGAIPKSEKPVLDLLDMFQLEHDLCSRYPYELSGGQQQRVAIARAFATNPLFIIADEPTSSLDAVIKGEILTFLKQLKQDYSVTFLFISHDLSIVTQIADRIGVMYQGELVEIASTIEILTNPLHPYTSRMLKFSEFEKDICTHKFSLELDNRLNNHQNRGCGFALPCPFADNRCMMNRPSLSKVSGNHQVACFLIKDVALKQFVDETNA